MPSDLVESAPAKVNLTLRVLGRRADGYHDIESLAAFADVGDRLALTPGEALTLTVVGPNAAQTGAEADNLVTKAARALAARIPDFCAGAFRLQKNLPVAAGLGGGSADAAAALRLLAKANKLASDDPRLRDAARATGADVPVCLDPRARLMRGIGEILSAPLPLPRLHALLVNPGVAVPTKLVFSGWQPSANPIRALDSTADFTPAKQTIWKRRRSRLSRRSPRCWRRCALPPAAAWPACPARAPHALRYLLRPRKPRRQAKSYAKGFPIGG